ncbi:MAG: hypothetical protein EHM23_31035 [Acidobacteria bacterium]|nr:MAG: hypothetical protein EHM23_31035 [Acidobacteriota bacterium]
MTEIYVIDPIDATHEGPSALDPQGERQMVHLMQGSLDGACGPYSLMMALLICGVVDRYAAARYGAVDRRTSLGRMLAEWHRLGPLVKEGTDPVQLVTLLESTYGKRLRLDFAGGPGVEIRNFVEKEVSGNRPVLLTLNYPCGGHWVVVVGLEYQLAGIDRHLCRFLVLDPAQPTPTVSAWNGVIDARGGGGHYPYTWWTMGLRVQFYFALSLEPKHRIPEAVYVQELRQ